MKLGEALTLRADLLRRIGEVRNRIQSNAIVQQGEQTMEDPKALIAEHESLCLQLEKLITNVNMTNAQTTLPSGEVLTAALAKRDVLSQRINGLRTAVSAADVTRQRRYSLSEIKMVPMINAADLLGEADKLAKQRRELDAAIQAHNWTTDLIEL